MKEMIMKIRRSTKEDLKQFDNDNYNNKYVRNQIKRYDYFLHIEMDKIVMNVPPSLTISQIIGSFKESKKEL